MTGGMPRCYQICVIGCGYVGLVTGGCLAYLGHRVVCVDLDRDRITALQNGVPVIHEPGLAEIQRLAEKRLLYTTGGTEDMAQADIIIVAVGTPSLPDGGVDLTQVEDALRKIAGIHQQRERQVVAIKSTVPAGTGEWASALLQSGRQPTAARRTVVSNPEFLREGSAVGDMLYPDRIVVGTVDSWALEMMENLYQPILTQNFSVPPGIPRPHDFPLPAMVRCKPVTAELIKYAANAFLSVKVSFINEIAGLCDKLGADVRQVAVGIGLDRRIGPLFLQAGIGWGGNCFGKDTAALLATAREYGLEMPITKGAVEVNRRQRRMVIEKLQQELKTLRGKTVGLLGLTFKPNTDDLRDAPALAIAGQLVRLGAFVKACDPVGVPGCRQQYPDLAITYADNVLDLAKGCDALVLVTEWEEFRHLPLPALAEVMRQRVLVDGRNVLDPLEVAAAGFRYVGFGSNQQS